MDEAIAMFQSTPGINAGRIIAGFAIVLTMFSFNPRPALMPGESRRAPTPEGVTDVSIHARH